MRLDPKLGKNLVRSHEIGGKPIFVFDGLFSDRAVRILYEYVKREPYRWDAWDSSEFDWSVRWRLSLPSSSFSRPFLKDVIHLVKHGLPSSSPQDIARIYVNFNLHGEIHLPHVDSTRGGYTALYIANREWDLTWQGETLFYDGDEAVFAVTPKPGRLIIFDGTIRHRGSAPSRDCYEPRINIAFKFEPVSFLRSAEFRRRQPILARRARVVRRS